MPESIEQARQRLADKRAERERLTEEREKGQLASEEQITRDRIAREEERLDADIAYETAAAEILAKAKAQKEGVTPPDNTAVSSTPSLFGSYSEPQADGADDEEKE